MDLSSCGVWAQYLGLLGSGAWTSVAVICELSTWGSGLWSMDLSSCGVWAQYLGLWALEHGPQ